MLQYEWFQLCDDTDCKQVLFSVIWYGIFSVANLFMFDDAAVLLFVFVFVCFVFYIFFFIA